MFISSEKLQLSKARQGQLLDWLMRAYGAFQGADIEEKGAILKKCNTSHSIKTDTLVTGKHGSHWGTGKRCYISPPIRTGVSEYISVTGPHGTLCREWVNFAGVVICVVFACFSSVVECSWLVAVCIEWSRLPVVKRTSTTHSHKREHSYVNLRRWWPQVHEFHHRHRRLTSWNFCSFCLSAICHCYLT